MHCVSCGKFHRKIRLNRTYIKGWLNHVRTGKRGTPKTYTDTAIECMLTLKVIYGLTLRSTEGFMGSIVGM